MRVRALVVLLLLGLVGPIPVARGHGGPYRDPNPDQKPPRHRDPSQPPSPPTDVAAERRPRTWRPSSEDWTFWYHNNESEFQSLKQRLYEGYGSGGVFGPYSEGALRAQGRTRLTQRETTRTIIPALLRTMDPKHAGHQATESAAYLALAKVTQDPAHIATILAGLQVDAKRAPLVQESAALAVGFLRRGWSGDQFSAAVLDGVRAHLFRVLEGETYRVRTRGFAAVALGLLGDQPTGSGAQEGREETARQKTTTRLFALLKQDHEHRDLYVGLLMAIGLQHPSSVTAAQRRVLADAAWRGRRFEGPVGEMVRTYAAHALGRVGTAADRDTFDSILEARRGMPKNVQRAAAIALGRLGQRIDPGERVGFAKILLGTIRNAKDPSTKNFAIISLAKLLAADIQEEAEAVIAHTEAGARLLELAGEGSYAERPWGALALGIVIRRIDDHLEIEAYREFEEAGLKVLRETLANTRIDKKSLAATAVAAGIAQDAGCRGALMAILTNPRGDKNLRSYAALGLGLIGDRHPAVIKAIAAALRERSSRELRRLSTVALGMLGNQEIPGTGKNALELLIDELQAAKSQGHRSLVVHAIATIGNSHAIKPLEQLLGNTSEQDFIRARACASVGMVGDLELHRALSLVTQDLNYRASTDLVRELASIF